MHYNPGMCIPNFTCQFPIVSEIWHFKDEASSMAKIAFLAPIPFLAKLIRLWNSFSCTTLYVELQTGPNLVHQKNISRGLQVCLWYVINDLGRMTLRSHDNGGHLGFIPFHQEFSCFETYGTPQVA